MTRIFSLTSRQRIIEVDAELQALKERQRALERLKQSLVFQHYMSVPLMRLRRKRDEAAKVASGIFEDKDQIARRNAEFRTSTHELSRKLLRADARGEDQCHITDEDLAGLAVGDMIRMRHDLRAGKPYLDVLEAVAGIVKRR
jgi:hypothetical protein